MTATILDPKFAKIIALMNSTEHAGERQAARERAETVAAASGMTLDQAIAVSAQPAPSLLNIFAGFDDWMEERHPGHNARCQAERSERERNRLARLAEILHRYGSEEAALAPCEREQLLQKALSPWIKWCDPPHQRWTYLIDGEGGFFGDLPPHISDAIAAAYPLPTIFAEACAEADYWRARNQEIEDVFGPENCGDYGLNRPAYMRMHMVEDLANHELPVTTLADLHARFARYRARGGDDETIDAALFRDIEAMAMREKGAAQSAHPSEPPPDQTKTGSVSRAAHSNIPATAQPLGRVADILRGHMDWTDRRIAREAACSPTTVGKIRRTIGATCATRSVQRCGQTYAFHIGAQA